MLDVEVPVSKTEERNSCICGTETAEVVPVLQKLRCEFLSENVRCSVLVVLLLLYLFSAILTWFNPQPEKV